MKRYLTLSLVAVMLLASVAFVPQRAEAQGPGLVSSILNKMERNRRDMRSLRAAVTMQKYNAQLKDFDMSYGDVQYVAGKGTNSNVRLDWTKPARELLAVSNGQYTLYRPRLKQAFQGSTKSIKDGKNSKVNSTLGFALNLSSSQAKNQFNIEVAGEGTLYDGGPHVVMLKLTPKGKAGYQFAEVWVDGGGMPVQTRVTERNGDSTLVRLTNIQRNAAIPSDAFDIKLGSDVKIVKS
ncbi:MAG TPA: outer membrane lipoprotein carrier protein LolA [Pyrinomonadaceae bacterium]|nr:outer membrane lipoprotein carrier protein LolA [Pyrinomonadaceae bacterium]